MDRSRSPDQTRVASPVPGPSLLARQHLCHRGLKRLVGYPITGAAMGANPRGHAGVRPHSPTTRPRHPPDGALQQDRSRRSAASRPSVQRANPIHDDGRSRSAIFPPNPKRPLHGSKVLPMGTTRQRTLTPREDFTEPKLVAFGRFVELLRRSFWSTTGPSADPTQSIGHFRSALPRGASLAGHPVPTATSRSGVPSSSSCVFKPSGAALTWGCGNGRGSCRTMERARSSRRKPRMESGALPKRST
jgi:hypothetical protein